MSKYTFGPGMDPYRVSEHPIEELFIAAVTTAQDRRATHSLPVFFCYEHIQVQVSSSTDIGLLQRDWLLAYYGATDRTMIGPETELDLWGHLSECYDIITRELRNGSSRQSIIRRVNQKHAEFDNDQAAIDRLGTLRPTYV